MKSSLTYFLVALALALAAVGGYSALYALLSAKSEAVADLHSQIEESEQAANHIASVRAAIAEIAGDEAVVRGYFISESGIVSFIDDQQARGKAQGATVDVLSVSTDSINKRPVLTLSLSIKGTFDAVMRTIGAIEYAPYHLSIMSLSAQVGEKKTWATTMRIAVGAASSTPSGAVSGAAASTTSAAASQDSAQPAP